MILSTLSARSKRENDIPRSSQQTRISKRRMHTVTGSRMYMCLHTALLPPTTHTRPNSLPMCWRGELVQTVEHVLPECPQYAGRAPLTPQRRKGRPPKTPRKIIQSPETACQVRPRCLRFLEEETGACAKKKKNAADGLGAGMMMH